MLFDLFMAFLLSIPASREKCYKQIEAAVAKYREIKDNINEGLKFYVTLQVKIFRYVCFELLTVVFPLYIIIVFKSFQVLCWCMNSATKAKWLCCNI